MLLVCYLFLLNLVGFVMMGVDKRKARLEKWRLPERNFFLVALLGGSLGCWLGMQRFHHKTLHRMFTVGMPLILLLQVLCLLVAYGKGFL